jgi:hypothetical protein
VLTAAAEASLLGIIRLQRLVVEAAGLNLQSPSSHPNPRRQALQIFSPLSERIGVKELRLV